MKKDATKETDKTAATTKSGMDKPEKIEKGVKKEAGFPGGAENAAGAKAPMKNSDVDHEEIGAKPVSDKSLNLGNKKN